MAEAEQDLQLDAEFESILGDFEKEYSDADVFSSWMPPDGEYTVMISGYDKGISKKGDLPLAWWKLTGTLIAEGDPDLNGKEFTLGFFNSKNLAYSLKPAVAVLAGRIVNDLRASIEIVAGSVGTVVTAGVERGISRKSGKKFTNVSLLEVIDAAASESEAVDPPTEPEAATE